MKIAFALSALCVVFIQPAAAQVAKQTKCCVRIIKEVKLRVEPEVKAPMKQDSVDNRFAPAFSTGISYGLTESLKIDAEFSHSTFSPHFDPEEYASPFISKGFATINDNGTKFRKNNILVGLTYNHYLHSRMAVGVSLRAGLSFNKNPDFTITQAYNGGTAEIAKYSAPANITPAYFVYQPGVSVDYYLTDRINVFISGKYVGQPRSDEFSYSYKDISKVDFNRTEKEVQTQIDQAPALTSYTSGVRKIASVGAGVSISFGGKTKKLNSQPQADVVIPLSQ